MGKILGVDNMGLYGKNTAVAGGTNGGIYVPGPVYGPGSGARSGRGKGDVRGRGGGMKAMNYAYAPLEEKTVVMLFHSHWTGKRAPTLGDM